jgi:dephospho-CoA kinase
VSNYVIGLTGGIGSGKSTVADRFAARGIEVVDTDAIAHELTGPAGAAMPALAAAFGSGVVRPDGGLDRPAMRQLVFADPPLRKKLEDILHPLIRQESASRCAAAASPYVILAVPLLVESGTYRERCDRILVVDCDEAMQISRVMARSGLPEAEVRAIMAAQASRGERLAAANDVIRNDSGIQTLEAQISELHKAYAEYSAQKPHVKC